MRRATLLSVVVALAVPAVLLGNGLWLLTNGWYVHAEYARPGFPDDTLGFTKAERTELALVGLDSIHPLNRDGVDVLRDARLPDGSVAFTEREIVHMGDVRGLVGKVLLAHAIALAAIVVVGIVAQASRLGGALSRGTPGGELPDPRSRRGARPDDADLVRLVLRPVSRGALHRRHVALRRLGYAAPPLPGRLLERLRRRARSADRRPGGRPCGRPLVVAAAGPRPRRLAGHADGDSAGRS